MGVIRLVTAPIRNIVHFPLFQLAVVVAIIVFLQSADDATIAGRMFAGLDRLTDATVRVLGEFFTVKSFTRSALSAALMIFYVYLVCLVLLAAARIVVRAIVDFIGWSNAFWLRNSIARERGIAAYRAWLPLERIRPATIAQAQWEETYAWPADNQPPYPPLSHRLLHSAVSYLIVILVAAALIQYFTPFAVLSWLGRALGFGGAF